MTRKNSKPVWFRRLERLTMPYSGPFPVGLCNRLIRATEGKLVDQQRDHNARTEHRALLLRFLPPCKEPSCKWPSADVCDLCREPFCIRHVSAQHKPKYLDRDLPFGVTLCSRCSPAVDLWLKMLDKRLANEAEIERMVRESLHLKRISKLKLLSEVTIHACDTRGRVRVSGGYVPLPVLEKR